MELDSFYTRSQTNHDYEVRLSLDYGIETHFSQVFTPRNNKILTRHYHKEQRAMIHDNLVYSLQHKQQ